MNSIELRWNIEEPQQFSQQINNKTLIQITRKFQQLNNKTNESFSKFFIRIYKFNIPQYTYIFLNNNLIGIANFIRLYS